MAKLKKKNAVKDVATAVQERAIGDPLGEAETIVQLHAFMVKNGLTDEESTKFVGPHLPGMLMDCPDEHVDTVVQDDEEVVSEERPRRSWTNERKRQAPVQNVLRRSESSQT